MPGREWAGTIVMFEDVTARARLEEQLRVSERMASLGLLAAGVAHEVNTPLTGISSYTQMLLEQADPADPRTGVLEKIEKQTFRAARIVNGLLNLSRPAPADDSERTMVDLNDVVADVLSLLEHQFDKGRVKVRRELAATPVPVIGFEFKLQQVFLNLFLNARDAMPSGGWLTIVTRLDGDARRRRGARHRHRRLARAPGPHLRPVLHHQGHRARHRPGPVDLLRHRPGARRHHRRARAPSARAPRSRLGSIWQRPTSARRPARKARGSEP